MASSTWRNDGRSRGLIVTLDWMEVSLAVHVATRRQIQALRRPTVDVHRSGPGEENAWTWHIEGAAGELAFAKLSHTYWAPTVDTFRSRGDVGDVEVRTRTRPGYELIVRNDDCDERAYVLVRGRIPRFEVVGWVYGREGKRPEWLQRYGGGEPAYFVPDSALHPIDTLVRALEPF